MHQKFILQSKFQPAGDQITAIPSLVQGVMNGSRNQVLLGVTGSGKTFTMAKIIEASQKPSLILAPNKTLAAQLYAEMKHFFPENAVEYFVSYYDYYQPEAYVPRKDLYIEKTADINEQIDQMRHAATRSLFVRRDVIIVASVSCIYGIGSPDAYLGMALDLKVGDSWDQRELLRSLVSIHYSRNDVAFTRGNFRVRGDVVEIFPSHLSDYAWRLDFFGDDLETIVEFDPLTGEVMMELKEVKLFANSHHVTPRPTLIQAIEQIKHDLKDRVKDFEQQGKFLEAQRLGERGQFDLEMMVATGTCAGIENYSRYLTGRAVGQAPPTLFEYLPKDSLLFVDESHMMIPQLRAMYVGDKARKTSLVDYGFRLPAALDNRPLMFEEWDALRPQTIFVSATPSAAELAYTQGEFVEQVIRPTGLIDPPCEIRPTEFQVQDLIGECQKIASQGYRALVTTLTKKMAEDLTEYMKEAGLKVCYIHSDVETLERIQIIRNLRLGIFDVLVGINLLREGLDIPECALVAILDADKEGYLRSTTSLIQTIGRAARNVYGRVILYADRVTVSMQNALAEAERRRMKQRAYNQEHGITPESVMKDIDQVLTSVFEKDHSEIPLDSALNHGVGKNIQQSIKQLEDKMLALASDLRFEEAAKVRDELKKLREAELFTLGQDEL